ncbi:unnamed protein product [Parascedosporium putredinis]|nr:unnamed protein product [Parascedosporium putredinis]CAI7987558.1 unnamed protein product [Parascedosporium putredinis]
MNRQDAQFLSPFEDSRPSSPSFSGRWQDPRSASTQSLVPSEADGDRGGRRRLLMIYIHGFYGNNRSFNSFPAHAHAYLKEALRESHVVHTKIYPRYKTYHAIGVGAKSFSSWLEPHEDETTDIVLVGHSMGPNPNPFGSHQFGHRILGVVALDTPFLGLHPGIIPTGIASLFRSPPENTSLSSPSPDPPELALAQTRSTPTLNQELSTTTTTSSTLHSTDSIIDTGSYPTAFTSGSDLTRLSLESPSQIPSPNPPSARDPNFNPPWFNDTIMKDRSFFKSVAHFTRKHLSEGVFNAAGKHFMSHMEYGACLADYPGLHNRYNRMRVLEDVDDIKALTNDMVSHEPNFRLQPARVRFVNYYTSSTGRIKPPKSEVEVPDKCDIEQGTEELEKREESPAALDPSAAEGRGSEGEEVEAKLPTPRISVELHENDRIEVQPVQTTSPILEDEPPEMTVLEPLPDGDNGMEHAELLDIPPPPTPPPQPPDTSSFPDKAAQKASEKETKALQKEYERAVKSREKLIKQRQKLLDKQRRQQEKAAAKEAAAIVAAEATQSAPPIDEKKEKKPRKFCALPRKRNGEPDSTWVSVFMEGMDEVGAHCGLFFPGPHYDKLVGDMGHRVVGWVQDDMTRRTIAEMMPS